MKRLVLPTCVAAIVAAAALPTAVAANAAKDLCVGAKPGCYPTIQPAVDAASDGDTIRLLPGTYTGGITINVSVNLVGAGAQATIINGGAPVILIGAPFPWSPKRPTVSISGITVTGGVNNVFPDASVAGGGGIVITPAAPPTPGPGVTGATVTISHSIVTGNQVCAQTLIPPGFCGPESCAFAFGGGIDNAGVLTLSHTRVTNNLVTSPPGVATGLGSGGISNDAAGTLRLDHSWVTGNSIVATEPNGREANGGGIASNGSLAIDHSFVNDNSISISSSVPADSGQVGFAGGILVDDCCGLAGTATIAHTQISGNRVSAANIGNDAVAFGGGIVGFGAVSISHSALDHNGVSATSSAGGFAGADGGGAEFDNVTTLTDTRVDSNTVSATSPGGTAFAQGGGIANAGELTMKRVVVVNNSAAASGANGAVQGGGVWNGTFEGPSPSLVVLDSTIVHNSLSGSPGLLVQGGGLYTDFPVTVTHTHLAANVPDQCFNC
jgi:hypothetical protein